MFALCCGMQAAVVWNAVLARRMLLPECRSRAEALVCVYVAAAAQVVGLGTALGAAGILNARNVPVALAALTVFVYAIWKLLPKSNSAPAAEIETERVSQDNIAAPVKLLLALAAATLAVFFIWAAVTPPPPTDAFTDHLHFAAVWLQQGRISIVPVPVGDQAISYYPLNASLILLWLLMPFRDDLLCNLSQWFALAAGCAAAYSLARKMRLSRTGAALAAALPALTPLLLLRSTNSDVDLVFAAFFLAGLNFLYEYWHTRRPGALVLCAAAFGLFAGTKYTAPLYALPFAPVLLAAVFSKRGEKENGGRGFARGAGRLLLFGAVAAAFCGFWYARNLAATGNPWYPMEARLFGKVIFPGAFGREAMLGSVFHTEAATELLTTLRDWTFGGELFAAACYFTALGALVFLWRGPGRGARLPFRAALPLAGAALALCLLLSRLFPAALRGPWGNGLVAAICLFLMAAALIFARREREQAVFCPVLLFPFYFLFIYWFVNPHNTVTNCRFLAPAVYLFYLYMAFLLERGEGWRRLLLWPVAACVVASVAAPDILGVPGALIKSALGRAEGPHAAMRPAILCFTGLTVPGAALWWSLRNRRAAGAVFSIAAALTLVFLAVNFNYNAAARGKYLWYAGMPLGRAWLYAERLTRAAHPEGATIAYTGDNAPYGLMGFGLRNRVAYINTDGCVSCRLHDYVKKFRDACPDCPEAADSQQVYRCLQCGARREQWLAAVEKEEIDLLFIFRRDGAFPVEYFWTAASPQRFEPLLQSDKLHVYTVRRMDEPTGKYRH